MSRCIMVQGTMSGAGKSLITAALCRIFTQDGWRVAPFKSQNMALNSYITKDGYEMGRAQVVQAYASGKEPDVRMNPILLKPSSDTGSQVIVNGNVYGNYSAKDYFKMKKFFIPTILEAYESLERENDIIVIEGAGSPAEINLKADDIVNMGLAKLVDAPVILLGDIDRGGVFAQLYGTVELLEKEEKERIVGTVINKFRGDEEILRPGLEMLEEKTQMPVLGVIPYTYVDIDDEDSLSSRLDQRQSHKPVDIAVIRLPHISNFTDFIPLEQHASLGVRYVHQVKEFGNPDMVILPGSKNTMGDLEWMRQNGLEACIKKYASEDRPILGICGGYQMLGETLSDPDITEHGGDMDGMGLLPMKTTFLKEKRQTRTTARCVIPEFENAVLDGYEIHMGHTEIKDLEPFCCLQDGSKDGARRGNIFGTYLHGLFDSGELTRVLAKFLLERKHLTLEDTAVETHEQYLNRQIDLLADAVRQHLDMERLYEVMSEFDARREEKRACKG